MNTLILGAGVSGLSCGILLLKKGYGVEIWAKDLPPNTTSNKAGASWYPYLCDPEDKVTKWGKVTYDYFLDKTIKDAKSGLIRRKEIEIFTKKQPEPWWKDAVASYRRPPANELPEGYVDGYEIDGVVVDTSIYMDYLVKLFKSLGGKIIQRTVTNVKEVLDGNSVVVNCTGLGSRELFDDKEVYPVRGQMVKIKPNGFDKVVADDEGPNSLAVIIPRVNDIALGGTTQANDWNLEIDPNDRADILRKVSNLYPQFKNVEIVSESVGLRPARKEVRLEYENFSGKTVIHNYGHGGAGFTLSWGCAQEVVAIVEKV